MDRTELIAALDDGRLAAYVDQVGAPQFMIELSHALGSDHEDQVLELSHAAPSATPESAIGWVRNLVNRDAAQRQVIKRMLDDQVELSSKIETIEREIATTKVDRFIESGQLREDQRSVMIELAVTDRDLFERFVPAVPVHERQLRP